jgi:hypothetical protein
MWFRASLRVVITLKIDRSDPLLNFSYVIAFAVIIASASHAAQSLLMLLDTTWLLMLRFDRMFPAGKSSYMNG